MRNIEHKTQNTSLFKNKYEQKGVTLIALVITIIVMLILVGVTINMALNGRLFGYAKQGVRDTENKKAEEEAFASGKVTIDGVTYDSIQDYMNGFPSGTPKAKPIDKVEIDEKGILKENGAYTNNGKTAIVPKGFKIVADENGEKSIDAGLVIQDEAENQYVWVPVEDGTLDRINWTDDGEPTDSDYKDELPEELINSIKINKGFYIGRYEAGSNSVRSVDGADTLTEVLTKKGLYPYNCVSQTNAINKIAEMYTNKEKYGVEATLPYISMWDETLKFVKDNEHNVMDSQKWGNFKSIAFKFTGKYCKDYDEDPSFAGTPIYIEGTNIDKPKDTSWLLTTGASERNKAKNIYDLAGNVWEHILFYDSNDISAIFGGAFNIDSINYGAASAFLSTRTLANAHIGFRPALYIK